MKVLRSENGGHQWEPTSGSNLEVRELVSMDVVRGGDVEVSNDAGPFKLLDSTNLRMFQRLTTPLRFSRTCRQGLVPGVPAPGWPHCPGHAFSNPNPYGALDIGSTGFPCQYIPPLSCDICSMETETSQISRSYSWSICYEILK